MALAAAAGAAATVILGDEAVVIARVASVPSLDWPAWAQDIRTLQPPNTPIRDVLAVTENRWRSLLCHDASCCPPRGRPLASAA